MGLEVCVEVALLREPFVAVRTAVRPLARVDAPVRDEVALLRESLFADVARVGPVAFIVLVQPRFVVEMRVTHCTVELVTPTTAVIGIRARASLVERPVMS